MSDVNVLITAVDKGIDLLNKYSDELSDIHACGLFDIDSTHEMVRRACLDNQYKIDEIENSNSEDEEQDAELSFLYRKQSALEELCGDVITICDKKSEDWTTYYRKCISLIDYGKSVMLEYILKLNDISVSNMRNEGTCIGNSPDYYVVILDSKKYPQTAEHIRYAIKKGMPEFVTLDRKEASLRRRKSLRNTVIRPIYDRDEWPMACFCEGGSGADVFYLDRSDNRGAGASIMHQMSMLPDGSRIRIRII